MAQKPTFRQIAKNSRAFFDFDIQRKLIAGIVLTGPEVKSIRSGSVSLKGSFANFKDGELWLNNMHISKFKHAEYRSDYSQTQARKLLLHKSELNKLMADKQNGLHIVILKIGSYGRYIKVQLGVAKSKKKHDKRQHLKRKDQNREIEKAIKRSK